MNDRLGLTLGALLLLAGCPGETTATGETPASTGGSTEGPGTHGDAASDTSTSTPTEAGTTVDPDSSTTDLPGTTTSTSDTSGTTGPDDSTTGEPVIPVPEVCEDKPPLVACDEPITKCKTDRDTDQKIFTCDNAPEHHNPEQQDLDGDGFGDIIDLCPTVFGDNNAADADKDGVGAACDVCPGSVFAYNKSETPVPFYMRVRNIPQQHDSDADGVGDVCDNCVRQANCQTFGDAPGQTPFVVGLEIDRDALDCQADALDDNIGDDCSGTTLPGAAGKVGFGDADDFDQDGLANLGDACPRQPVKHHKCDGDGDCPDGASCSAEGMCNHADHDKDGVGDICDTCPDVANPEQVTEAGAKLDDPDGDFIGAACEQNEGCVDRVNPRRFGFYDVSAGGYCCTTIYDGTPILDPAGVPVPVEEWGPQPAGVLELPAGCEQALMASEDGEAHAIEWCNVDAPGDLYQYFCLLPTWDQEFDGVPDECDLCTWAYDPSNAIYIDANDKEWPSYGKFCNGDYSGENLDPAKMCAQGS